VPTQVLEELEGVDQFAEKRNQCVFCSLIGAELATESRVVAPRPTTFSPGAHMPVGLGSRPGLRRGIIKLDLSMWMIRRLRSWAQFSD